MPILDEVRHELIQEIVMTDSKEAERDLPIEHLVYETGYLAGLQKALELIDGWILLERGK